MLLDDSTDSIPGISPVCSLCAHKTGFRTCAAFEEIPLSIWLGKNKHKKPVPGDGGYRFLDITDIADEN